MNEYQEQYDAAGAPARDPIAEAAADMQANWLPDHAARTVAAAMLAAAPDAEAVIVPLVQPGKTPGVWTAGQKVVTVDAYFLTAPDGPEGPTAAGMPYGQARNAAAAAGDAVLDGPGGLGGGGTVAWAVIERDGHVAVFEW